MNLTKDADKLMCYIYYMYLDRVEFGNSKSASKHFDENFYQEVDQLSDWHYDDIVECLESLKKIGFIKLFITNSFYIEDSGIVYMENRFKNGLKEIISYVTALK